MQQKLAEKQKANQSRNNLSLAPSNLPVPNNRASTPVESRTITPTETSSLNKMTHVQSVQKKNPASIPCPASKKPKLGEDVIIVLDD